MKFSITARHFASWPELNEAAKKAADNFTRLHPKIMSTEVILSEEHDKEVEFIVHVQHHVLSAKYSASNFDKSIHSASDKIIAQLRKIRDKESHYRRM